MTARKTRVIALGLMSASAACAEPDIDLGKAQSGDLMLLADCSVAAPLRPQDRCTDLLAQPAETAFSDPALTTVQLPADATRSQLCFSLSPFVQFNFLNRTREPQPDAYLETHVTIAIESAALNGQSVRLAATTYLETRSLGPEERVSRKMTVPRSCGNGGVEISKGSLVQLHGLTAQEADQFFHEAMTITFGAVVSGRIVEFLRYNCTVRILGD